MAKVALEWVLAVIPRYLVVALLFGLTPSTGSSQTVRGGIEAWQRADYATAVANWRPLAEKGDPDAAFNLGQAYRLGRGVTLNLAAAQTWFERAAVKGHLDAQTTLGLMLFESGDRNAGARWLKVAAEHGEPRALLVYGTALFNGDAVKKDPLLGYAYISRAAAQGLVPAKATLEQLDQILPLEVRKRALRIAMTMAKPAPPPKSKAVAPGPRAGPLPKQAAPGPARAVPVKPALAPVAVAATSGGWRIQLGAFSQRASAETLFRKLSGNLAGRQAYFVPAGGVTRLQVGPYATRAAAAQACASLRGQACFPVPAK